MDQRLSGRSKCRLINKPRIVARLFPPPLPLDGSRALIARGQKEGKTRQIENVKRPKIPPPKVDASTLFLSLSLSRWLIRVFLRHPCETGRYFVHRCTAREKRTLLIKHRVLIDCNCLVPPACLAACRARSRVNCLLPKRHPSRRRFVRPFISRSGDSLSPSG